MPVPLTHLDGMDSLLSIVQMPAGVPVATVSIGGARNAGLLAVRILAAGQGDEAATGCASGWCDFQAEPARPGPRQGRARCAPAPSRSHRGTERRPPIARRQRRGYSILGQVSMTTSSPAASARARRRLVDDAELQPHRADAQPLALLDRLVDDRTHRRS